MNAVTAITSDQESREDLSDRLRRVNEDSSNGNGGRA